MEGKFGIGIFVVLCLAWQAQAAVNCTAPGRFPDPTDITCKNYTYCVPGLDGKYTAYNYVCPSISRFNPATARCSTLYVCNVTLPPTKPPTSSLCTDEGLVADPNSTDCTNYIQCISENDVFVEYETSCPVDTFFNPETTDCEETYVCKKKFECSAAGRFANPSDKTCKKYYLCVLTGGAYSKYEYTCPSTSVFNPDSHLCTTKYKCP